MFEVIYEAILRHFWAIVVVILSSIFSAKNPHWSYFFSDILKFVYVLTLTISFSHRFNNSKKTNEKELLVFFFLSHTFLTYGSRKFCKRDANGKSFHHIVHLQSIFNGLKCRETLTFNYLTSTLSTQYMQNVLIFICTFEPNACVHMPLFGYAELDCVHIVSTNFAEKLFSILFVQRKTKRYIHLDL